MNARHCYVMRKLRDLLKMIFSYSLSQGSSTGLYFQLFVENNVFRMTIKIADVVHKYDTSMRCCGSKTKCIDGKNDASMHARTNRPHDAK